jgi:adenylate cyclase
VIEFGIMARPEPKSGPSCPGARKSPRHKPELCPRSYLSRISPGSSWAGNEALAKIDTAERFNPRGRFHGVNSIHRAAAYFTVGKHREAIDFARKAVLESPGIVTGYRQLVVNCALVGEMEEARAAFWTLKHLQPDISPRWIEEWVPYLRAEDRGKFIEGFRLAGLK